MPAVETLPPTVEQLLKLPKEIQADIVTVLEQLSAVRYTGPVTFHYHCGVATTIQILPPQIRLKD